MFKKKKIIRPILEYILWVAQNLNAIRLKFKDKIESKINFKIGFAQILWFTHCLNKKK